MELILHWTAKDLVLQKSPRTFQIEAKRRLPLSWFDPSMDFLIGRDSHGGETWAMQLTVHQPGNELSLNN